MSTSRPADELAPPWYRDKLGCSAASGVARRRVVAVLHFHGRRRPHDEEQIIARVAALDIGKTEVVCCVRVPSGANAKKRLQEVSTHSTMTRALTELANHLVDLGVERVVREGQVQGPRR